MTTTTTAAAVKVGDYFVCSWGYDQTNIDFYRVVGVTSTGKSVRVQKWQSATRAAGSQQDWCVPGNGPRHGRTVPAPEGGFRYDRDAEVAVETRRLRVGSDGRAWFTVNSYSVAVAWEGEACYATAFGYGH